MKSFKQRARDTVGAVLAAVPAPHGARAPTGLLGAALGGSADDPLEAYGSSATLFPIVNKNANSTASTNWHMHRLDVKGGVCMECDEEGVQKIEDHLALRIWNRPNPFYNRQEFVEGFQQHVELCGESFWMVEYWENTSIPKHMWIRWPHTMWPVPSDDNFLDGWLTVGKNSTKVPLELNEVIQIKMPDPADPYRGLGAVQAAMVHLGFADLAAEWNNAFFRNSARPDGIIGVEGSNDTEVKKLVHQWREQHQGVSNAHRIRIIGGNAKWQPVGYNQNDMQFEQLYRMSEEFIRKAFNFPTFYLGEPENSNRAAAEAAKDFYNEELIVPRLERIKGVLNDDFLKLFGSAGQGVAFSYTSPVVGNTELKNATAESRARVYQMLVTSGVHPEDAAREAGLPPMRTREMAGASA